MSVRPSVRATALALAGLLSVPVTMAVTTTGAAAAPAPCKVVEAGKSGSKSNLQAALDAAGVKATLTVTGTCAGSFTVTRTVTLKKGAIAGTIKGAGGRALHVTGGTLTVIGLRLTGSTVSDCPDYGEYLCGAVLLNDAKVVLDRVTVSGSTVDGGATKNVYGSALYNSDGATMTIKRSTITNNAALTGAVGLQADAVIANEGTLTITRSTLTSNRSAGDSANGGALYTYKVTSVTTVVESVFSGNTVEGVGYAEGGAIEVDQGSVTIRRSLFSGNKATGPDTSGGAMVANGSVFVEDSTFTKNQAKSGGAIHVPGTTAAVALRGSTIVRNSGAIGGGIVVTNSAFVGIGSTIIALNTASVGGPDCAGTYTSAEFNLIGKDAGCSGFTQGVKHDKVGSIASPLNPKLGTLAANGGPTKTVALLKGSPAIDAAGAAPCDSDRDQRGVKRPQNGTCDIGAFERS